MKKENKKVGKTKNKQNIENMTKENEETNIIKDLTVRKNKKEKNKNKAIEMIKKRWLLKGATTALLVLLIVTIYIGVNFALNKVVLPEYDSTKNKLYSLSAETKTKVKALKEEVKVTIINFSDNEGLEKIMDKYKALSNKIKIEKVNDLASRKDLMQKYSLETSSKVIIIASGENEKTLSEYNLYTYDYYTYETIDITEEAITNAIVEVTTKKKPKVYFSTNHVMYDINSYYYSLIQSMKEEANEVEILDILVTGKIPEDCDTLVLTTLKEDITSFEKDQIIEYINKGGKILLLCGANVTNVKLDNFKSVLEQYGMTIGQGVIFEGVQTNMLYGHPNFIIEKIQDSSFTENSNMNFTICLAEATSITFDEDSLSNLGVEYEKLAYTSESAFIRTNFKQTSPYRTALDSNEDSYLVGAIATKKVEDNKYSKLIVYSNELFVSDMLVNIEGYQYAIIDLYNNKDIVLNSIAYLNGREDIISIRKTDDTVKYTVTKREHNIIMAIIFVTPLMIIIVGIIVWQVRRRKR